MTPVTRKVAAAAGFAFLLAPPAVAQQSDPPIPFEEGRRLYEARCALCHGVDGDGLRSTIPALSGNEHLDDLRSIVTTIRQGGDRMPPFPDLTPEEVAALVGYVRNAWENDFGVVTMEDVRGLPDGPEPAAPMASIWDGVFAAGQAQRGLALYDGPCGWCHGRRLNGAPDDPDMRSTPPLARAPFLRVWEGRSLATLYQYIRATMPENSPGSLTDQEYVDLIAYMLEVSGAPAGAVELLPDPQRLARVLIEQRP